MACPRIVTAVIFTSCLAACGPGRTGTGESESETLWLSGQAVAGLDGRTIAVRPVTGLEF